MEKYFDLILELLDLENQEELKDIAHEITEENKKGKTVFISHRYKFLFDAWLGFLEKKLSLEEFLEIGDLNGNIFISSPDETPIKDLFEDFENLKLPNEDILVLDGTARDHLLSNEKKAQLENIFLENGKKVFFLA